MNRLQALPVINLLKNVHYSKKQMCLYCALLMLLCFVVFRLLPEYHWLKFEILIGEVQEITGETIRKDLQRRTRLDTFLATNGITDQNITKEILELWNRNNFVFIHDIKKTEEIAPTANFTCKYLGVTGKVSMESAALFRQFVVEVLTDGLVREKALVQKQQLELLHRDILARNEGLDFRISFLERHIAQNNSPLGSIEEIDFNKLERSTFFNLLGEDSASKPKSNLKKLTEMKDYQAVLLTVAPEVEQLIVQYNQIITQSEETGVVTVAVKEMLEKFRVESSSAISFGHVIEPLPVFPLFAQLLLSFAITVIGGVLILIISLLKDRVENGHAFI